MQRYFVPGKDWAETGVFIEGDDFHHITRVMRMIEGNSIICNHPNGQAALCTISKISSNRVDAIVTEWLEESKEIPVQVTIAQGLPKGDKMETILQKGTELGAHAFLPFQASRSIVKWDEKKAIKKEERFKKIVKEASEQSHRTSIPTIYSITSFQDLLDKSADYDVKVFAYEEEAKSEAFHRLSDVLQRTNLANSVLVCIGPEGGFSLEEVAALKEYRFISVRLGPRILRTETASLYFLASVSYHFEEMRC